MSRETANIDKLISNHIKGLKVPVPPGAWDRMDAELNAAHRKKVIFWFRLSPASVLLLLAFGAGFYFANLVNNKNEIAQTKHPAENQVETLNNDASSTSGSIRKAIKNEKEIKKAPSLKNDEMPLAEASPKKRTPITRNRKDNSSEIITSENKTEKTQLGITGTQTGVPENLLGIPVNLTLISFINTEEINIRSDKVEISVKEQQLPEIVNRIDPAQMSPGEFYGYEPIVDQSVKDKWTLGGQFAPIYSFRDISTNYSSGQTTTSIAEENKLNSAEQGLMAYAGGINIDYNLHSKWSLQSGLYYSRVGQVNTDALEFSQNSKQFVLVSIHTSTGDIDFKINNLPPNIRSYQSLKDSGNSVGIGSVKIMQNFDFFEIPFLVKYKVFDKKLALNFTGGLSPAYLINNTTYLEFEGEKYNAGAASNLNNLMINSSLGIGVEYAFTRQLFLNFQPTFKYALSPLNSSSLFSYHPYSFSWFTGISYRF